MHDYDNPVNPDRVTLFSLADRVTGRDKRPLRPVPSRMARRNIARLTCGSSGCATTSRRGSPTTPATSRDIELRHYLAAELAYLRAAIDDPLAHFLPDAPGEEWGS